MLGINETGAWLIVSMTFHISSCEMNFFLFCQQTNVFKEWLDVALDVPWSGWQGGDQSKAGLSLGGLFQP